MIKVSGIKKRFGEIQAVDNISAQIKEGSIFGLVGTNGSGKSTFLRMLAGVLKPDEGTIEVDGESIYENSKMKEQIFFIAEDAWYFPNSTPVSMMEYYATVYPEYNRRLFLELLDKFHLDPKRKIQTFSKGMRKQVSLLLGICARTKYLLCDETFDGLDPVMRQAIKSLLASEIIGRNFTPVIASHSLRELEDICDHVGLLHKGGLLLSEDLEDLKFHIHKVQCVLPDAEKEHQLLHTLDTVRCDHSGSLMLIVARGTRMEIMDTINRYHPIFSEIIPLSLEEIFISETEVAGYEVKDIFQ